MPNEYFFDPHYQLEAINACRGCPVRAECLADALTIPATLDDGIRGGYTARARQKMSRTTAVAVEHVRQILKAGGEHTTGDLAERVGVAPSTIRGAVAQLRAEGHVSSGGHRNSVHRWRQ